MYVSLSRNSFVRLYDNDTYGYIINQLTYHDRVYNETGATFLSFITREAKSISEIVEHLVSLYAAERALIEKDFNDFINDLYKDNFILLGENIQDLIAQEMYFSYAGDNPKTLSRFYNQDTDQIVSESTEEFYLKHDQLRPRLTSLQFELTSRCNERCIHCYIPNNKKNHGMDMPLESVKSILDQFSKMNGLRVVLSGGEVLLHKDLPEILRYCRLKDLQISILSNLTELSSNIIEVLKETNVSIVQVSLYSMDSKIHDSITTVKGSHEKTLKSIEVLHKNDIPVQISCPIMRANMDGYKKVTEYASSLKIKSNVDYVMMAQADMDTSNLVNRLNLDETRSFLEKLINNSKDYKELMDNVRPYSDLSIEEYGELPMCGVGLNQICVAANGDLYPCAGWQSLVLGNIYSDSLQSIWEKSETLSRLRKIRRKDFPQCLNCENKDFCSVCLVRNYNESNGDLFSIPDHVCQAALINKQVVLEQRNSH